MLLLHLFIFLFDFRFNFIWMYVFFFFIVYVSIVGCCCCCCMTLYMITGSFIIKIIVYVSGYEQQMLLYIAWFNLTPLPLNKMLCTFHCDADLLNTKKKKIGKKKLTMKLNRNVNYEAPYINPANANTTSIHNMITTISKMFFFIFYFWMIRWMEQQHWIAQNTLW